MAKKIVIQGNDLLESLNEDWGGRNNTLNPIDKYGTTVPAGAEWGMNKAEVERFIKAQFGTKASAVRWNKPDGDNYFYLLLFATAADAEAWDEDPTSVEPIETQQLPISTVQADSYIATLSTSKTGSTISSPFVMKRGVSWEIPLRFNAWRIIAALGGEREPIVGTGTLVVERSTNGVNWDATTITKSISAVDVTEGFNDSVDIGDFVNTGQDAQLQVRLRASLTYIDQEGNEGVVTSQPLIIHVKTVTLGVSLADNEWQLPKVVQSGSLSVPSINFTLLGGVEKTLHVKMSNTAFEDTYTQDFTGITAIGDYPVSPYDSSGTMGITNSGVHQIKAWVTCDDGEGGTLTSDTIVHQIMVVNMGQQQAAMVRRVLIQGMAATIDNFVQSQICSYMVWNPKLVDGTIQNDTSESVQVQFIVADTLSLADEHETYLSLPVTATPGDKIPLNGTIEVESDDSSTSYNAYLHALDSQGNSLLQKVQFFIIDNTAGFQPISGSVFKLNPKTRNNGEATPQTIINARTGEVVQSTWEGFKMDDSDGYTTDEQGNKVLRVPAGRKLTISLNPFAYFYNAPQTSKALSIGLYFRVRNVTNEKDAVFRIAEYQNEINAWLGLMMRPMDGTMVSVTSGGTTGETDFRWAEDRMQHLYVTITPNVYPNPIEYPDALYNPRDAENANGSIDLVRVYLNGVIIRELKFTPGNATEFCTGAMANGGIVIGQTGTEGRNSGADIDIYGFDVYEFGLKPSQVLQNHISALPSSDEKRRFKAENDILRDDNTGRLSLAKCKAAGKNCMIWHSGDNYNGEMPLIDSDKKKGWIELWRYSYDGTYLPEYSGTICKASKNLQAKGQGTTAMTYYYWNMQVKLGDVTDTIELTPDQIHPSIHLGDPVEADGSWTVPIYGGCLGKDYPVGNGTKSYPCTVDGEGNILTVTLPDGWIDGNGLYRGQCWQPNTNRPLSQKLVLKINYASSMQSHLIGINWLYNALHTSFCGENSLQQGTPAEYKAQVAKQVEPMLLFTTAKNITDEQQTEGNAVYQGPGGFGPGKMDKPTWGYSSKYSGHNYFGMFEGAANNTVLSDFLAPWDDTDHVLADESVQPAKVKYFLHDPVNASAKDPESFFYRHTVLKTREVNGVTETYEEDQWEKGIGFDSGKTGTSGATAEMPAPASDVPDEAPAPNITKVVRDAWNYVYLHNPNINLYKGTFTAFQQQTFSEWQQKQKWVCIANGDDPENYMLKRWDFCERRWVDAGLWNASEHAYEQVDIRYFTGMDWDNMTAEQKADKDGVVAKFKRLLIADAYPAENHSGIGAFFKTTSLQFHYAFINMFIAGTDNCSKNTYYVIDPSTHLIELHQDDVDTTLATDNYGYQTKPYYVDREHPYSDDTNQSCYDGMQNGLFDLVEALWLNDDNHTIAQTLGQVLERMVSLTGGIGTTESNAMSGVWQTLNKYLFDIQRYIPKVAFNEAARIRYEFPAMVGYSGRDGQARPLAQSMGDQLEAEIQFMKRRLVYMASYAAFGEFSPNIGQGRPSTGIADLTTTFSVPVTVLPNGDNPEYTYKLKPHQYLYPCWYKEGMTYRPYQRVSPSEEFTHTISGLNANDYALVLPGLNYYQSIGNVGDLSASGENFRLEMQGTRLTEFLAEPTYYYPTEGGERITASDWASLTDEQKAAYLPAFRPKSASVSDSYGATRIRKLSLKGCTTVSHSSALPMDLRRLVVAEEIDLRGTNVAAVRLPQTSTLTTLRLPAGITTLRLENLPSLTTVSLEGGANVESLYISNVGSFGGSGSYTLFDGIYNDQTSERKMSSLVAYGINWNGVSANQVRWMLATSTLDLKGSIAVSGTIPFVRVVELMDKFGNILDPNNATDSLYVSYTKTPITSPSISGAKDVRSVGTWTGWSVAVGSGNNIGVRQLQNGKYAPHITWSLSERDINDSADSSYYATLTDDNKGYFNVEHVENAFEYTEWNEGKYAWDDVPHKEFELTVNIVTTDSQTITVTKKVRFANRAPHVGDFARHDGTFDNEVDGSKKLVGTVIMRELEYQTPADPVSSNNPPVSVKCWVYAKENASIQSNIENDTAPIGSPTPTAVMSWGVYNDNNNSNGFSQSVLDDANNGLFAGTGLTHAQVTNVYGSTDDISTRSVPATDDACMTEKPSQAAGTYCKFIDQAEFDGYMKFTSGALADFDTEIRNTRILDVANAVINRFIIPEDNGIDAAPRTPTELANAMRKLELKHHVSATEARYYQFFYPAAYACHVYTPIGVDDSMLDEQYKQGHWMLPSEGLLARIFNFKYNSMGRPKTTAGSAVSGSISTSYANENPSKESLLPLFANLMKRINDTPSVIDRPSFDYPGTSHYWSSTEYNPNIAWGVIFGSGYVTYNGKYSTTYVARGVAAYHFSLNP